MGRSLWTLWRSLRRRDAIERELDDEIRSHLEFRADDLVEDGFSRSEAVRRARLEFGNPEAYQDRCRDARRLHLVDDFVADLRFAARNLARHRLLSAIVVVTLGSAIGISSGIFTLYDAAVLRPRVERDPSTFAQIFAPPPAGTAGTPGDASLDDYAAFTRARTLRILAAHRRYALPVGSQDGARVPALLVTCNFFETIGAERPLAGRLLLPQDCDASAPVAVLDEALWRSRYNAEPSVIGSSMSLNGVAVTIVGVAPAAAAAVDDARVWLPLTLRRYLNLGKPTPAERWLSIEARLAEGVTRRQAAAELGVLASVDARPRGKSAVIVTDGSIASDPRKPLVLPVITLVMTALSCLVLIACANIAVLLLSKADARQQEIAVRLSLGAGRGRLLRMLLTETLLLSACAGAISVWLAYEVPILMFKWIGGGLPAYSLSPDWRAFTFLAVTTALSGVAAGLALALESMRVDVLESLKGRRGLLGAPATSTLRNSLVVVQVALSFVLLVGSGLFAMTHYRIATADPGFDAPHVLIVRADATPAMLARAAADLPGAQAIAFARTGPVLTPGSTDVSFDRISPRRVDVNDVSPEYFRTIGLQLVSGRPLEAGDRPCGTTKCHVVVSEAFVREIAADAIGRVMRGPSGEMEVVGIVKDLAAQRVGAPDPPIVYAPWTPDASRYQAVIRFEGDPAAFSSAAAAALRRNLPGVIGDARTARWYIDTWLEEIGPVEVLILALGASAAALAVIGVFGVVSFNVSRRARELGVRAALGARPSHIYAVVIGGGLKTPAAGLAVGIVLALGVATAFRKVLVQMRFSVSPEDPLTYAFVAVLLTGVIVAALAVPAGRAARVDPLAALRCE